MDGVVTSDGFEVESESERSDDDKPEWILRLPRDKKGALKNTFAVLCAIIRNAPEFATLRHNDMTLSPELHGETLPESEALRFREHIENRYGISPAWQNVLQAIQMVSRENRFHPVREYLQSLRWDGTPRVDSVLERILGVPNVTELHRLMLRRWFVSAVARGISPGSKVDTALVLVGKQGHRKSTFFSVLGGEWFNDSQIDIRNKDSMLQLAASWIYEWGEIEQITNAREASEVKAVLSSRKDLFRPPYERGVQAVPRGCVLVGTTNQAQFLNDETGSRRFWVIPAPAKINVDGLAAARDQLWAEAVMLYQDGETWWLEESDDQEREADAERYQQSSPWEDEITAWLSANRKNPRMYPAFKLNELMEQCLQIEKKDQDAKGKRVAKVLKKLGFEARYSRVNRGNGSELARFWFWPESPTWLTEPDSDGVDDGGGFEV